LKFDSLTAAGGMRHRRLSFVRMHERFVLVAGEASLDAKRAFDGRVGKRSKNGHSRASMNKSGGFSTEHAVSVGEASLSCSFFLKTDENELDGFMNY
jgi:hypothetical protein